MDLSFDCRQATSSSFALSNTKALRTLLFNRQGISNRIDINFAIEGFRRRLQSKIG